MFCAFWKTFFVSGRVFGCLKNLKRLVVVRVSGVWDRFCVATNTHKVLQVPEHDQQHTNTLDFSDSPDARPATTHLEFVRHLNHNKTGNKKTLRVQTLETRPAPQNKKFSKVSGTRPATIHMKFLGHGTCLGCLKTKKFCCCWTCFRVSDVFYVFGRLSFQTQNTSSNKTTQVFHTPETRSAKK